ncbi:hypothetical protein FRB90_000738 [Tulasnella sp. 427]|nr:hypothetical protein FRB90_000738 [Tulasnella sp. 427]
MSASPITHHLWHSPQSAGALARNLAENLFYNIYAHFCLIYPENLSEEVLSILKAHGESPALSTPPDTELLERKVLPAVKFLLPILRDLLAEKERQDGTLVKIDPCGDPAEKRDWNLHLSKRLRRAQEELRRPQATPIQRAMRQIPITLREMVVRLSSLMFLHCPQDPLTKSHPSPSEGSSNEVLVADAYSQDLIDMTTVPPQAERQATNSLPIPLLLTPMSQVSWIDSDDDDSADERDASAFSPQRPLGSPLPDRGRPPHRRAPSTAPTTPAHSPYIKSHSPLTREALLIPMPPPESESPVVVLTTATSSADSQEDEQEQQSPVDSAESSSSPSFEDRNAPVDANKTEPAPAPVATPSEQEPRSRESCRTPERSSSPLPAMATGNPPQRPKRKPVPKYEPEDKIDRAATESRSARSSVPGSPRTPFTPALAQCSPISPSPASEMTSSVSDSPSEESKCLPSLSIVIPPTPPTTTIDVGSHTRSRSTPAAVCSSARLPEKSLSMDTNATDASTASPSIRSIAAQASGSPTTSSSPASAVSPERRPSKSRKKIQVWKGANPGWAELQQAAAGLMAAAALGQAVPTDRVPWP